MSIGFLKLLEQINRGAIEKVSKQVKQQSSKIGRGVGKLCSCVSVKQSCKLICKAVGIRKHGRMRVKEIGEQ